VGMIVQDIVRRLNDASSAPAKPDKDRICRPFP
jgi:hypothetical protein